jgi:N-acetylmuramoyl-L-alanine amidase
MIGFALPRLAAAVALGLTLSACGMAAGAAGGPHSVGHHGSARPAMGPDATGPGPTAGLPAAPPGIQPGMPSPPAAARARPPAAALPLAGITVGIDPGHNADNGNDPAYIGHLVWNGRQWEACDTTGTQTDAGYAEALFTFRVAVFLRADLRRLGARVVMTRSNNHGVGPCVNSRSEIINHAHARVALDIHADGGPPAGRGFTILEPVPDGPNDHVIRSSERFARDVRRELLRYTPMPESDYYGVHGLIHRDDLAGLNLTRVPKVLIECGNMRNATDARLLTSGRFQRALARAFTAAIRRFLHR